MKVITRRLDTEVGNGTSLFYRNLYFSALPRLSVNFSFPLLN